MHWILPKDFSDWETYDNWDMTNQHIKYYSTMCVLGHFKFIKPNIFEYFKKRVNRNQDWGESDEYRNYLENPVNSFYKEGVSVLYESSDKIYLNIVDMIEQWEIIIIISDQRMGTTTLCEKLDKLSNSVCLYEAFVAPKNPGEGRLYSTDYGDMKTHITEILDGTDWMRDNKYISFKLFRNHNDKGWVKLDELFQMDMPTRVIFLKRSLTDSYASWKKAHETGNWGTTPERQEKVVANTGNFMMLDERHIFDRYSRNVNRWFSYALAKVQQYNVPYKEVWFGSVIHDDFYTRGLLNFKTEGN
jgi:hypothetical protein